MRRMWGRRPRAQPAAPSDRKKIIRGGRLQQPTHTKTNKIHVSAHAFSIALLITPPKR